MNLSAVIIGFIAIIAFSKKINMGLSFLLGSLIIAFFAGMRITVVGINIYTTVINTATLELIVIITLISGLGYLLQQTGDLELVIDSLISLVKNSKSLSMIIPLITGILEISGKEVLLTTFIEDSEGHINSGNFLGTHSKASINIFFRHIGLFIYPLYIVLIVSAALFNVSQLMIIKYNFLIMLGGFLAAYLIFFNDGNYDDGTGYDNSHQNTVNYLINVLSGLSPILIIIILIFVPRIPFYIAVFAGFLFGISRNIKIDNELTAIWQRLKDFFINGVDYKLVLLIAGIIIFKDIIEASGSSAAIAEFISASGLPLAMIMVIMGLITGSLTGINTVSMGLLIPIFITLIPGDNPGPYISLLFTSSLCGYLLSPIYLLSVVTEDYFKGNFISVYQQLGIPVIVMITIAFLQLLFFI